MRVRESVPDDTTSDARRTARGGAAGGRCRVMRGGLAVVVLCVAGVACGAGPAAAATWRVAPDGSGDFPSIQEAIEQARDGDTIVIRAGRYVEDVTVHGKARLKIIGAGPEQAVIEGLHRVGTLHIGKWPYGATDVEISGLTIQQHGGLGVGMFNGERVVLKNLRVNGQVFGQDVRDARIERCVVDGSETTGLAFADSSVRLIGNVVRHNDHGVSIGGASTAYLEGNVITHSLYEAVLVTDSGRATLRNNTLADNGGGVAFRDEAAGRVEGNVIHGARAGIAWSAAHPVTVTRNGLHNNAVNYQIDGAPASSDADLKAFAGVYAAPRFVAPSRGDYRLKSDSPLRHVGDFPYLGALAPVGE